MTGKEQEGNMIESKSYMLVLLVHSCFPVCFSLTFWFIRLSFLTYFHYFSLSCDQKLGMMRTKVDDDYKDNLMAVFWVGEYRKSVCAWISM